MSKKNNNSNRKNSQSKKTATKSNSKKFSSKPKIKSSDVVFALDIGTHSVIGMIGIRRDNQLEILEIAESKYPARAMLDGQIQDIEMVSKVAGHVRDELSNACSVKLTDVYVAAAGRTLKTIESTYIVTYDEPVFLDDDIITRINSAAIEKAEQEFEKQYLGEENKDEYYLSGYSISSYKLDGYPMPSIREHQGKSIEARAIVTFLPRQVVESLYTAMTKIDLEVAGLTLEPIAAMNAAIPNNIRLLNLALVDVGAGTSDIAISKDGSVVGYTMVTVAGDEITEAIMKKLLIDFDSAEELKISMTDKADDEIIKYNDILAIEHEISIADLKAGILDAESDLAREISQAILSVNETMPSAVFLVGGGSRLEGLTKMVAQSLGMDEQRVAMGGNNFDKNAFSLKYDIRNPAYATGLGIALSAGFNLNNEGFFIKLNEKKCRLFRSGTITVFDVLMMNGYSHRDLFARKGESLSIVLNGVKKTFFGELSRPAVILVNGKEAKAMDVLSAGDEISFTPAVDGENAKATVKDAVGDVKFNSFDVFVNNDVFAAGEFVMLNNESLATIDDLNKNLKPNDDIKVASIWQPDALAKFYGLSVGLSYMNDADDILSEDCHLTFKSNTVAQTDGNEHETLINNKDNINQDNSSIKNNKQSEVTQDNIKIATEEDIADINSALQQGRENHETDNNEVKTDETKVTNTYSVSGVEFSDKVEQETVDSHTENHIDSYTFNLNGRDIVMPAKPNDEPYILIDMLLHTGFDFDDPKADILILVNGQEAGFTTQLKDKDRISITWKD